MGVGVGRNPATSVTTVDRLSSIVTMWQPQFVEQLCKIRTSTNFVLFLYLSMSVCECVCVCVIRAEKHLRVKTSSAADP